MIRCYCLRTPKSTDYHRKMKYYFYADSNRISLEYLKSVTAAQICRPWKLIEIVNEASIESSNYGPVQFYLYIQTVPFIFYLNLLERVGNYS